MTNEELAVAIAQGRDDLQLRLWEQVKAYVHKLAYRAVTLSGGAGGTTVEDLEQVGFIALLRAVENYDPARGSFLPCLTFYLRQEYAVAGGYRTSKRSPLDSCLSLDAPVTGSEDGGEDLTFLDTLPDMEDCYAPVDDTIYNAQLHDALDSAIGQALPPGQAEIMRAHYWSGETATAIAQAQGCSTQTVARQLHNGARRLRRGSAGRTLREFLDSENLFSGVGLKSFSITGSSAVERTVLRWETVSEQE